MAKAKTRKPASLKTQVQHEETIHNVDQQLTIDPLVEKITFLHGQAKQIGASLKVTLTIVFKPTNEGEPR